MQEILITLGATLGAGIVWGILGYCKSATSETFNKLKFASSAILGIVVGGVALVAGTTIETAGAFALSIGAIATIETGLKAIWRALNKNKTIAPAKKR